MYILPRNSYYKEILRLALPAIAGLSTQMVVSLVDTALVGRLEEAEYALAAMGLGVLATWAIVSFFSSLATGTHVIVARRFGQKDYGACSRILYNSILNGLVVGTVVTIIFMLASRKISHFFAADPIVGDYAGDFLFYRFLGIPFFLVSVSFRGFFFGISRTKIFMFTGIMTNVLNIFFNILLVYGNLGVPRLGLAGAGLGSTLATAFDALFYVVVIMRPAYRKKFEFLKNFKFDKTIIRSIYKISLPVSFQNIFILIGFLAFVSITGLIGTKEQAATQTVISTLFMSFLPCFGFGIALQTLVGNNLGSGKYNLAKIYGFETAKIATYFTIFLSIFFILTPQLVLNIVTNEQSIIEMGKPALRIAGFAQIFYATGVVLANGLQAAGETFFVMMSEVITNLVLFVPLAYLMGVGLDGGLEWAWAALPVYIILYSLIIFLKFRSGKWRYKYI